MHNFPFLRIVKSLLPSDTSWHIESDEPYVYVRPQGYRLQQQGWKIFVSSTFFNAEAVIERAAQVLIDLQMPFKFVKSRFKLATEILAKPVLPAEGAKSVVIYPRNPKHCHTALCRLTTVLERIEAPPVLSGRRFSNSPVYYRYGAHRGIIRDVEVYIRNPETQKLVPDLIQPWYEAPPWIHTDPFQPDLDTDDTSEVKIVLNDGRYAIQEALSISNSGGIYVAEESTTHEICCIKEGRPFMAPHPLTGEDAISRLTREAETLKESAICSVAPKFINYFIEDEHAFLVRDFIDGETLADRKEREPFTASELATLAHALEAILALREIPDLRDTRLDLSPHNVIFDGTAIKIIDFETDPQDAGGYTFGTPGFIPPRRVCPWHWGIQALLDFCENDQDGSPNPNASET